MKSIRSHLLGSCAPVFALALCVSASPAFAQDTPPAAVQAEESSAGVGEIVVTAQRREQDLQTVPITINAFNEAAIETRRISDFEGLSASVPGLSINSYHKGRLNPSLRGGASSVNSTGAEQSVGMFIDDQYFGGPGDFEMDMFDVERIEVLRGPQGTLFGRNTTGGSIQVITRRPSETFEGKIEATLGNYNALETRGYVTGPLAEHLLGAFAFSSREMDGTSFNLTTGNDIDNVNRSSFRGKLLWEATPNFDITASVSFSRADETGNARDSILPDVPVTAVPLINLGYVPDNDPRVVQQWRDGSYDSNQWTGNLRAEYQLENASLLSVTTYRDMEATTLGVSLAGFPIPVYDSDVARTTEAFSQEFRYTSDYDGPFNWVGGVFYYDADVGGRSDIHSTWADGSFYGVFQAATFCALQDPADTDAFVITPACTTDPLYATLFDQQDHFIQERTQTSSYSGFVDGNFELFDGLTIFAGVRYTHDEKDFDLARGGDPDFVLNPPTLFDPVLGNPALGDCVIDPATGFCTVGTVLSATDSWSNTSYRVGVQYQATDDLMLFATRSTGFRSGVFSGDNSDVALLGVAAAPEYALSHEVGFKSQWFDNRFQANLTLFHVEYTDLQFWFTSVTPGGANAIGGNAGEATVEGAELELIAAVNDYLTLSANYSHQDGETSGLPAGTAPEGQPPNGTIPNTYMFAADLEYPLGDWGDLIGHIDYSHKDPYALELNSAPQFISETEALVNANIGVRLSSGLEFTLWGQNLTDEDIVVYGNDFWGTVYDFSTAFITNPEVQAASQPRYAPPRTYGVTMRYTF